MKRKEQNKKNLYQNTFFSSLKFSSYGKVFKKIDCKKTEFFSQGKKKRF